MRISRCHFRSCDIHSVSLWLFGFELSGYISDEELNYLCCVMPLAFKMSNFVLPNKCVTFCGQPHIFLFIDVIYVKKLCFP